MSSKRNDGLKPTWNHSRSLMMGPPTSAPRSNELARLSSRSIALPARGLGFSLATSAPGVQ